MKEIIYIVVLSLGIPIACLSAPLTENEMMTNLIDRKIVTLGNFAPSGPGTYGEWYYNLSITNSSRWGVKDFDIARVCFAQSGTVLQVKKFKVFSLVDPATNLWAVSFGRFEDVPGQTASIGLAIIDFEIVDYVPPPSESELAAARAEKLSVIAAKKAANAATALEYNQRLAAAGDSYGELRMGERYRDGDGVAKDLQRAREWLAKASAQGDKTAVKELSELPSN